jgi:hypothetical protein
MTQSRTPLIVVVDPAAKRARVRRPKPLVGTIGGGGGSTGGGHGPVFEPGRDRLKATHEATERDRKRER